MEVLKPDSRMTKVSPGVISTNRFRTYAKLCWLGVEPKTVQLHGKANTTTPVSVLRKSLGFRK